MRRKAQMIAAVAGGLLLSMRPATFLTRHRRAHELAGFGTTQRGPRTTRHAVQDYRAPFERWSRQRTANSVRLYAAQERLETKIAQHDPIAFASLEWRRSELAALCAFFAIKEDRR